MAKGYDREKMQRLLDSPDSLGFVRLPKGEFEGPFRIGRPVTIIGNDATFWAQNGPVLDIRSTGVSVKELQIEITGRDENAVAVRTQASDTSFENVTVFGSTEGIGNENGEWGIPRSVNAGTVMKERYLTFYLDVCVPSDAHLISKISGVSVSPSVIHRGENRIELHIEPISEGTVLYGDIEVRSSVTRKIYLGLRPSDEPETADGSVLYKYDPSQKADMSENQNTIGASEENISKAENTVGSSAVGADYMGNTTIMQKGQRCPLEKTLGIGEICAELRYSSMDEMLDIDAYIFLLGPNGMVYRDTDLIFFGNNRTGNGSVRYDDEVTRKVWINLSLIPENIEAISIAYSVYGDELSKNFSKLHNIRFIMTCGDKSIEFPMTDLFIQKTIIAAQLYRKNGEWRVSAVGQGYRDGLKRLCESYNVRVV